MKNASDGLTSRLDTAEESRTWRYINGNLPVERETEWKKKGTTEYPRTVGKLQKGVLYILLEY